MGASSIREQLQVARSLGLIEIKPRTGIKVMPYSFSPAVIPSLAYAVSVNQSLFEAYADLRKHIETSYWFIAVTKLSPEDIRFLSSLVSQARTKLRKIPIEIPHTEHKELHLAIYRGLQNPFVIGLLEAYWKIYETIGLNVYLDKVYLDKVWDYHQQMVEAIASGEYNAGYQALVIHMGMIQTRNNHSASQFE